MQKEFDEIIRDLKNKIYYPLYILEGDEPYYVDIVSEYIEKNVLNETEKSFNLNIVYGRDTNDNSLAILAKGYPMFGNYSVVIVKEAQHIKSWKAIAEYSSNPLKSTLLVLCFKNEKLDKRKTEVKELAKNSIVLTTKRLYDNQIPAWIDKYVKQEGYTISSKAAAMLADFTGTELSKVVNELGKLMLNVKKTEEISHVHIQKYIGVHKDFNVFELQKALGLKDVLKSNQIAQYFNENDKANPMELTIGSLYSYFNKVLINHQARGKSDSEKASLLGVHPFIVKEYDVAAKNYNPAATINAIHLLNEYDLKSKGIKTGAATRGELLKELVYKILH